MDNHTLSERVGKIEVRQEIMDFTIKSLLESIKEGQETQKDAQETQKRAQEKNDKRYTILSAAVLFIALGDTTSPILEKLIMRLMGA